MPEDPELDPELHRLLARWSAPVVPRDLDDRVLAAFADRPEGGPGSGPGSSRRAYGCRCPWLSAWGCFSW